jgi:hypothetical protein
MQPKLANQNYYDVLDESKLVDEFDITAIMWYYLDRGQHEIKRELGITVSRLYKLLEHFDLPHKSDL